MWPRLNQSFGNLAQTGFNGHRFPICIGETGSFYDFSLKVCLLWQASMWLLQTTIAPISVAGGWWILYRSATLDILISR